MTDEEFDALARSLPEVTYADHFGMGAYKVAGKKIFACPSATRGGQGLVKLTPEAQEMLCAAEPDVFTPAKGQWGASGGTAMSVAKADEDLARSVLWMAWRATAPRSLVKKYAAEA